MQSCPIFEEYRKSRMIIGSFRYGFLQSQIGCARYDNVGSIEKRLYYIRAIATANISWILQISP